MKSHPHCTTSSIAPGGGCQRVPFAAQYARAREGAEGDRRMPTHDELGAGDDAKLRLASSHLQVLRSIRGLVPLYVGAAKAVRASRTILRWNT
jgi:hypothetical protein